MGNTVAVPLLGCYAINILVMKDIVQHMVAEILARAGNIMPHQWTSDLAHLQPYHNLSCVTYLFLLERYRRLINGEGEMTPEQVHEYVRLLLSVASTMDFILEMYAGHTAVRVENDMRSILSQPALGEDDRPEPVVYQHEDWKEGTELQSPLVRTSTPPPQSMVHILSLGGAIQMQHLPLPDASLRSLVFDQLGRSELCQQVRKLFGLPETMDYKDVGYIVLLLWDFLLHHGLHGPLDMRDIALHTDIVPVITLLNLAPVDKAALLVLQCLFAQVLSVLGYEPNPEEEGGADVELLAPRPSLLDNPGDISMCTQQLIEVLQQQVQGSA